MTTRYLEDLIYKFLSRRLDDKEKRELYTGYDAERHIDEETEEEMRVELFNYVKSSVQWYSIIARVRADIVEEEADEEESDEEEEQVVDCDD